MNTDPLVFNGINGATGEYLQLPSTAETISKMVRREKDESHLNQLKHKKPEKGLAARTGIKLKNLAETGWGVIFAATTDNKAKYKQQQIKEALSELLKHRQQQATQKDERYYQEYIYDPSQSLNKFLGSHRVEIGQPADPKRMPYYLLIVADPETIPYSFQYQLDVQYAVGRIHFDKLYEYAQYARNVVAAETGELSLPRHASFFGVRNSGDLATQLSADQLIAPLADWVKQDKPDWQVQTFLKEEATKAQLGQLLRGNDTPSLLFTASHGMGFPNGDPRQLPHQGALLCQDWPGLKWGRKPIPEDFYFSADDVSDDDGLLGMISFHFACYGAGMPKMEDFAHNVDDEHLAIAPYAFVAKLPQRLLSHPKGGALAVIGHVERAWGCSFVWPDAGQQLVVFEDTLKLLMEGCPVGAALECFNNRYATIATVLNKELKNIRDGKVVDNSTLCYLWTANNDARNYAIVGDPAVRLMLGDTDDAKRPVIAPVNFQPSVETETPQNAEIKQAQNRLTEALEQFIPLADKEKPFDTTTLSAKGLLKELKKLN